MSDDSSLGILFFSVDFPGMYIAVRMDHAGNASGKELELNKSIMHAGIKNAALLVDSVLLTEKQYFVVNALIYRFIGFVQ